MSRPRCRGQDDLLVMTWPLSPPADTKLWWMVSVRPLTLPGHFIWHWPQINLDPKQKTRVTPDQKSKTRRCKNAVIKQLLYLFVHFGLQQELKVSVTMFFCTAQSVQKRLVNNQSTPRAIREHSRTQRAIRKQSESNQSHTVLLSFHFVIWLLFYVVIPSYLLTSPLQNEVSERFEFE